MRLPLRLRLTLMFTIAMAIVLVGFGVIVYVRVNNDLLDSVDAGLRSRAQVIVDAAGIAPPEGSTDRSLIDPDEAFAQVLDTKGRIIEASSAVADTPLLSASELPAGNEPIFLTRSVPDDDPVRLMAVSALAGPGPVVVVGATLGDVIEAVQQLLLVMATIGPLCLMAVAAAGWLLAGAALRPVERMRREAAAVSASEPGRRLPVPDTGDELARLATTLNSMLDRLQAALEREHRFVDDASHELRTPLATLRAEIDLALSKGRDASELEAALRSAHEDVERLQRLTDDLLLLARTRAGQVPVRRTPTRLGDLLADSVRTVAAQADAGGVRIVVEANDATLLLDPDRIDQALRNLLENALRHTPRGQTVRLRVETGDGVARFIVTDGGPGFDVDVLPRAFEPFLRGDTDLDGSHGAGLGLAIVRAVAEAHGGTATAENTPDGARVTLQLAV